MTELQLSELAFHQRAGGTSSKSMQPDAGKLSFCLCHVRPSTRSEQRHHLATSFPAGFLRFFSCSRLGRTRMRIGTPAKLNSRRMAFMSCRRMRSVRSSVRVKAAKVGGRALTCSKKWLQ